MVVERKFPPSLLRRNIGLLPGVIVPVFIEFTDFYLELSFQYYRVHWLTPGVIAPVFIEVEIIALQYR